jgi:hypothetical protein
MQNRDTHLESKIADSSLPNFVLFPLPSGDREYSDYMTHLRERSPPGHLHSIVRSGHEFVIGRMSDLSYLFPASTSPSRVPDSK